eukprot:s4429_g4.t1
MGCNLEHVTDCTTLWPCDVTDSTGSEGSREERRETGAWAWPGLARLGPAGPKRPSLCSFWEREPNVAGHMASFAKASRRRLGAVLSVLALCASILRVTAVAFAPWPWPRQLSLAAGRSIAALAGVLPAFPAAAASDGGAGFQAIMFAPVISLFAIIGVAMIGGFVLGIFVPPGEGDYGDFETTLGEREARERGWRRGVLRGYDEETYAAMRGQSKEWAQVDYPFRKPPKPEPQNMPQLPGRAPQGAPAGVPGAPGAPSGAPPGTPPPGAPPPGAPAGAPPPGAPPGS